MPVGARRWFIGHDLGTGGNKAVLVDAAGGVAAAAFEPYPLAHPHAHWAEQDPEDWWGAVTACTRALLERGGVDPGEVAGMAFAGQMLALVPLDAAGRPARPAIGWLDSRAEPQARRLVRRLGGARVVRAAVGAVPSGKDVVCKIAWLREHEPAAYRDAHAFCDATGYLVARATGRIAIDPTGAAGTGVLDRRARRWSRPLARLVGVALDKLPPVAPCTEVAGGLTAGAAGELGLRPGTPVITGAADVPAAALGSGALGPGDAHFCLGTSSWLCISVPRPKDLARSGVYSVPSPDPAMFLMIGESETAGACLDWLARVLGLAGGESLHAELDRLAAAAGPGARGLLFAPWMFGERAPVTDTTLRGAFLNLSLEHRREHLVRAVYEGIAYNLRWLLDTVGAAGHRCASLRAIGGGARSHAWLQLIADVTGRRVEAVERPQQAGAVGAALLAAVALGDLPDVRAIEGVVRVERRFEPRPEGRAVHGEHYRALRSFQPSLSALGRRLNAPAGR